MLEAGKLSLTIDSLFPRVKPKIKGFSNPLHTDSLEFNQKTRRIIQWFNKSYDSIKSLGLENLEIELAMMQLRENFTEKDNRQLLHFVQTHPDSYYAFWKLVSALQWNDYFPEYEETLNRFSEKIRDSYAAKVFQRKISEAKMRTVGGLFPVVYVKDSLSQEVTLDVKKRGKIYTLIDFWFSSCQPCIAQFPEYVNLYNTYRGGGFEIISISTDHEKNESLWKSMIRKHHLRWPNYIDYKFDASARMNITKYPTNFLMDETGKIIAKDLSLKELKTMLESNINRN
jgi:thiol-disulfide isomerase/thioredoxin